MLFASPLSITLWTIAVSGFVPPILIGLMIRRRMAPRRDEEGALQD